MLLRWALTPDIESVLWMLNDHGGRLVEGNIVTRVQPQTWDELMGLFDRRLVTERAAGSERRR
jgi:hypothetical protein